MGKVIAVASGKGGTGKTTTVAAVSSCLAALGQKTLCIDFDQELSNLDLALCMTDFTIANYMDVVSTQLDLMEACHESPQIPNLFFLSAPSVSSQYDGVTPDMKPMFDEIRREFDYCFIDSPSGVGVDFRLAHANADMSIIVTTGEMPAMRDAQKTACIIRDMGVKELRLLVNRILPKNFNWLHATIDSVIDTVGVQLIGIVLEDESVFRALHENVPLILYNKRRAAYDYLNIARRIMGEDIPLRRR